MKGGFVGIQKTWQWELQKKRELLVIALASEDRREAKKLFRGIRVLKRKLGLIEKRVLCQEPQLMEQRKDRLQRKDEAVMAFFVREALVN